MLSIISAIKYAKRILPTSAVIRGASHGEIDGTAIVRVGFRMGDDEHYTLEVWEESNGQLYGEW